VVVVVGEEEAGAMWRVLALSLLFMLVVVVSVCP